jgi:capsular exopolysaccharide synthesis family protein
VDVQRQLIALEAEKATLKLKAEIMREQVDRLRQNLGALSQEELEFTNLRRAVESDRDLVTVLSERLMAARMREQGESGGFRIMDPASYPSVPSREQLLKLMLYALALAAACAFAIPFGLERWRDPVETESDVEGLELPLLGCVATFSLNGSPKRPANGRTSSARPDATSPTPVQIHHEMYRAICAPVETVWPESPVRSRLGSVSTFWRKGSPKRPTNGRTSSTRPDATSPTPAQIHHEMYRAICATIETVWPKSQVRSILLTSPGPGEGKSTTAINLAYAFQEFGQRVLLIEADLRRPVLARRLRLPMEAAPDLVQFLQGSATFEQVCRPLPGGVTVIPSSIAPGNATILLASQGMRNLLTAARDRFDIILCDSAPVLAVPDNILLSKAFEAAIVVVKASATSKRQLAKTARQLGLAEARILGVVLNHANTRDVDYYHHRYRRYYTNAPLETEGEPNTGSPMTKEKEME